MTLNDTSYNSELGARRSRATVASGYVLITPVRNEEKTIGTTIRSVIRQTLPPKEWVIVSDASTDRTDDIVTEYASKAPFIRLLRLPQRHGHSFSSVVYATEAGINAIETDHYEFIGLLDGDVAFEETYYEALLQRFAGDPQLGLAGGLVIDCIDGKKQRAVQSLRDVAGAVQFFRRECFEAIGKLLPIPEGGWDAITCVRARMSGFNTRTFQELEIQHLKPRNVAAGNILKRTWQLGIREYAVGNHPLFELAKCFYRCVEYPYVINGFLRLGGYVWCHLMRRKRLLPTETIQFIHSEQLGRLFRWPVGKITTRKLSLP